MRKYLLLLCLPFVLLSCKKEPVSQPVIGDGAALMMLKVNYATDSLEGGKIFNFPTYYSVNNNIPVVVTYMAPKTSGHVTLTYDPTADTLFDGGINIGTNGTLNKPNFNNVNNLGGNVLTAVAAPTSIQKITATGMIWPSYNLSKVWAPIANLSITKQFMDLSNVQVGLFLYTPDQNSTDTTQWSWVWVLYKAK